MEWDFLIISKNPCRNRIWQSFETLEKARNGSDLSPKVAESHRFAKARRALKGEKKGNCNEGFRRRYIEQKSRQVQLLIVSIIHV